MYVLVAFWCASIVAVVGMFYWLLWRIQRDEDKRR